MEFQMDSHHDNLLASLQDNRGIGQRDNLHNNLLASLQSSPFLAPLVNRPDSLPVNQQDNPHDNQQGNLRCNLIIVQLDSPRVKPSGSRPEIIHWSTYCYTAETFHKCSNESTIIPTNRVTYWAALYLLLLRGNLGGYLPVIPLASQSVP